MTEEYLTIEETADKVKVRPDTVRDWLRRGRLKGYKAGRLWRIRPQDLDMFMQHEQSSKES